MTTLDIHTLTILSLLLLSLLALAGLSRLVSLRVQAVTYYVTGSGDLASVVIFLLLLPGVFLHEGAHWLTARAVGLRTGKFRVWPSKRGNYIGLGSVSVERADIWRESLVGIAPLLAGNAVLALIGWRVFATPALLGVLATGELAAVVGSFFDALRTADGLVWAYAVFAVGNSMMPSASDREPFKPVLLYTIFAALIYVVVGLPLEPMTMLLGWIAPAIEITVGALIFLLVLDGLLLAVLWPLEGLLRRQR
ncbi:MAG: hypothetical protein WAU00_22505 [Caldilinea sp.]